MRLALPCLLLSLSAAASAQLTEKEANSQLKAALKEARKTHAGQVAGLTGAALAAIDAFTAAAPTGVGAAFDDLFEALETFQNELFFAFRVAQDSAAIDGEALIQEFADGVDLAGVYPDAFYFGDGGPLDDLIAALRAAQAKAVTKVRKRLAKAAGKLAKTSTARLSYHLEAAVLQGNEAFIQDGAIAYTRIPLVLHTALALGFEESADSGTVRVAGLGEDGEEITVRAISESPLQQVPADFFELGSPTWHATIDAGGEGQADGNVLLVAQQGAVGTSFGAFVSVR